MTQTISPPESAATELRPLCVDLDGTLVKSDTLIDSMLVLLRTRPLLALGLPVRVLRGKAAFKAWVTQQVSLDVVHLPYN
ncbi:MAG: prenyltransferase, partial [Terracidiphilus sp.]